MTSLTFYPYPRSQESALSLIFRCAIGNGISTAHLVRDAYQKYRRPKMINALWERQPICNLLTSHQGFSKVEIAAIRERFYTTLRHSGILHVKIDGLSFPSILLRPDLALCPSCAQDGHLHCSHLFTFCEICPIHGERFIDNCPKCDKKLDWLTLNNFICPCGFNLRQTPKTLFNTFTGKIISKAFEEKNQDFFDLLVAAICATRFAHNIIERAKIIETCTRIASNNKSFFFREIEKIQDQFPSLHRRAILAPFLLSPNPTLSEYALEYLFSASQSHPRSHSLECRCGDFQFNNEELRLIFCCRDYDFVSMKQAPRPSLTPPGQKKGKTRYQCSELCKALYNSRKLLWEKQDEPAQPIINFKHVRLQMAAELLQTNSLTVRRLINSGLLKGFQTYWSLGLVTAIHLIKDFNDKYVLRSELVRRSGLDGRPLKKMLADLTPIAVHTTRYASSLLVYQRKHLSEELRIRLEKNDLSMTYSPSSKEEFLTFQTAALRLKMTTKDIIGLRNLGILLTSPYRTKLGKEGQLRCTFEGMKRALSWRNSHISISEIDAASGHSARLIHARFIETGAVNSIHLHRTYVTIYDAKKIINHLQTYITATNIQSQTNLSPALISRLIENKKLNPLPPNHPGAIDGLVVFKIEEAKQVIIEHKNNTCTRINIVRTHRPPPRRLHDHYLTSIDTINNIAKSIGAIPIQKPFNIDND